MRLNKNLKVGIEKYKNCVIVVEGKKDVNALKSSGFKKVYPIHATGISIKERAEQIIQQVDKKDRLCILTDLDKKGKQIYYLLKSTFQELGVHLDSSLRGILTKSKISHIEGVNKFFEELDIIA